MPKLPEVPAKCNHQGLVERVSEIVGFIEMAVANRTAAHEVEEGLWRRVLKTRHVESSQHPPQQAVGSVHPVSHCTRIGHALPMFRRQR